MSRARAVTVCSSAVNPPAYSEAPHSYGATGYQQQHPGPGPGRYQPLQPGYQQVPQGYPNNYRPAPVYVTTTNATVVQTQPSSLPRFRPPKPATYLWLSVITMICCCFVLGLIAIIVGMDVRHILLCVHRTMFYCVYIVLCSLKPYTSKAKTVPLKAI